MVPQNSLRCMESGEGGSGVDDGRISAAPTRYAPETVGARGDRGYIAGSV
jgi:hypothetical protein